MKIQELRLIAFGPFTGKTVDLAGDKNFHVFYGPNEAGKSSTLRAIKALFFGVAGNSSDDFIHKFSEMRLGATLVHSNGASLEFVRRKGSKNTFMDIHEKPSDESALAGFLNGISEQQFETAFGLNHQLLIKGAQELLQAGGDVGEALFSAALGTGNLRKILEDMETESSGLYAASAKNPVVNKAIKEISDLQKEIRDGSLSAKVWEEKQNGLDKALIELRDYKIQITQKSSEKLHLEKYRGILPKLQQLMAKQAELEHLDAIVILPDDFGVKRGSIQTSLHAAMENQQDLEKELSENTEKAGKLTLWEEILTLASEIEALRDAIGSYRKNQKDLPGLEAEEKIQLAQANRCIRELGGSLTLEEAIARRPILARRVRIQSLAGQYQSLLKDASLALRAIEATENKLKEARRKIDTLGAFHDVTNLAKGVERISSHGDIERAFKGESLKLEIEESSIRDGLKRLGLEKIELEDFTLQSYPSLETLDQFETAFQDVKVIADKVSKSKEELGKGIRDAERELAEIQLSGNVPLEIELEQSRQVRQNGWALIRRAWEHGENVQVDAEQFAPGIPLGEAYENRVSESDSLSDRLRREAERVSRRASLTAILDQKKQEVEIVNGEHSTTMFDMGLLQEKWNALWNPFGINVQNPKPMRSWLLEVYSLQTRSAACKVKHREIKQGQAEIEKHITSLSLLLSESGFTPPLPQSLFELMEVGRTWVSTQRDLLQNHGRLIKEKEELENTVLDSASENQASAKKLEHWRSDWSVEVINLGLESTIQTESALAVLDEWDRLFKFKDAAAALRTRISGIQSEIAIFDSQVQSVATSLKESYEGASPDIYASSLLSQLEQAKATRLEQSNLANLIRDTQRKLDQERKKVGDSTVALEKLCLQAATKSPDDLEKAEEGSKHAKRMRDQLESIKTGILDSGGGLSLEQIRLQAGKIHNDTLPQQLIDLELQIEVLESSRAQIQETIGGYRGFLQMDRGPSDALKASEKMQQSLASARDHIERYVRLKTALILLKKEIERHRKENQNPILTRASHLYARLTLGSFAGLGTDYDGKDQPVLVGVRPNGKFVDMEGMSDGARDQVYLALRIATLEKYLEAGEPIPFIVDDILIRFDEERAKATLEILAELSIKTQVLFFTHQARIQEIAIGIDGGNVVSIHSMS